MISKHGKHYQALHARAERAVRDLYHNATLPHIPDLYGRSESAAQSWLQGACEFKIEYLQDGGSAPGDYRATLAAPCNAGRYKSERAQQYYIAKGMRDRDLERADCGMLTGFRVLELAYARAAPGGYITHNPTWRALAISKPKGTVVAQLQRHDAQWERITEFGKLYQYGRGGRTLAPTDLWRENGYGHGPRPGALDLPAAALVDLVRVVESFNRHVGVWCAGVPEQWREHCAEEDAEILREKRVASARKAKETRERNYWAARDVMTVPA